MSDSAWIALIGLGATLAGFGYTWFKDARDRRWALEDAKSKAAALVQHASAIAEGTQKATDAYHEANAVNNKIADLNADLKAIHDKLDTI